MFRIVLVALVALLTAPSAHAGEGKTWYIYCEGHGHGMHWAVFSRNFWAAPESDNYGRRIGSAAEEFIESRHSVNVTGCSGVKFFDQTSARYSRDRTVRLHKKMGDRVYFFNLPTDILSQ